jgi:hypothetical protein
MNGGRPDPPEREAPVIRRLVRWLAPLLLVAACTLPVAAQSAEEDPTGLGIGRERNPVLQTAVAIGSTLLVLVIVCMPSRKGNY